MGAVVAWFLLASCRAYDADLLASSPARTASSASEACRQRVELCNGEDDDCDNIIDEGASATCSSQHARERCVFGTCELLACDYGFVDCDGDPDDGCEQLITSAGCALGVVTSAQLADADAGAGTRAP